MDPRSPEMQACIDACLGCYRTCLGEASGHCLTAGGRHTEPKHLRLMLACAETCRTSAHLMLLGTPEHRHTCAACVALCEACAASCERVGDMDQCVRVCRDCAEQCRRMAG
ncbi:four-helix bundle copper-binding protein [Methylobacterium sp. A54F]